jgi:DNA-binding MarR family transcriptional regulator
MIAKGFIVTIDHPEDARSLLLKLTAKGQRVFEKVFPEHLAYLDQVFKKLPAKRLKEITEALIELKSIFNEPRS